LKIPLLPLGKWIPEPGIAPKHALMNPTDRNRPPRRDEMMERYLDAGFWIDRLEHRQLPLMDTAAIARFNQRGFNQDPSLIDLASLPDHLSASVLSGMVRDISKAPQYPLYLSNGYPVETQDYRQLETNMDLPGPRTETEVRFGLVLQRTDMRTWPSALTAYKDEATIDLDRFQENGLFPGDGVAVLHESLDGNWYFACSYNYAAWVRKAHIAMADRQTVMDYGKADPFLVVTGSKATTNYNPRRPAISELQLDMGLRLPLVNSEPDSPNVDGQNPFTSYAVQLPIRDSGEMTLHTALIARSQDVQRGFLDYTPENIIRQGFKFLGERYGWGHSYNSRDCSGLVTEIFRSFGILIPRNTRQQVSSLLGHTVRFGADDHRETRMEAIRNLAVGDLIYSPGHVMIYIGSHEERPFVLHDTSSSISFRTGDEDRYEGILNGVSVTPLLSLRDEEGRRYLDTMWAIKRITSGSQH